MGAWALPCTVCTQGSELLSVEEALALGLARTGTGLGSAHVLLCDLEQLTSPLWASTTHWQTERWM